MWCWASSFHDFYGYQDLFVEESKTEYINMTPIQAYQAARS